MRRRELLALGGAGLVSTSLVGCDLSTDPSTGGGGSNGGGTSEGEAPTLAELVEQGELPPLEERLPAEPMVVEPIDGVGQYGGSWDLVLFRDEIGGDRLYTTVGYEQLVRWAPGAEDLTVDQVIPNVARDFSVEGDGKEFVFHLREGMKWSDGEPMTADDIVFWYEAVASNEELRPVFPDWLQTAGEPGVVEKQDDHTVVFRFSEPNGLFLINLASQRGAAITGHPAHYMQQFHPDYNDDVDAEVADAGLDTWVELFSARASLWENPDLPVLNGWILDSAIGAETNRTVGRRNPYYWKTDTEGNQLPYIDEVTYSLVEDPEAAILQVSVGDVDTVDRRINSLRNKPVFAESRGEGNYDFFDTVPQQMNQMVLMLNLTHQDPVLRDLFSNKDFRVALSHAIDRQEIIDAVFQRQGQPWQAAPRPESVYYNEELAKQYTEFDPDLANSMLDEIVPDTDGQGRRLTEDGDPINFQVLVNSDHQDFPDAMDLVRSYWSEVGISIGIQTVDGSLFSERLEANQHDACTWVGGGGLGVPLDPFYYMPYNFNTRYAIPWHFWYLDPDDERAIEPPEPTRQQVELYRQLIVTADQDEQDSLMHQILDIAVEQFYCMGIALRQEEYGIVHNRIKNAPAVSTTGWLHAELMPNNPQQFYVDEESA